MLNGYVNPMIKSALKITPPLDMYSINLFLRRAFKSSSMNLVVAKTELEDAKEYLIQQEIITMRERIVGELMNLT